MNKFVPIFGVFLSLYTSQSQALKIDTMFFIADSRGNGVLTLTNDEDKMLFIDTKIEEITVSPRNEIIKSEYTQDNVKDWKVSLSIPKLILRPQESKKVHVRSLCHQTHCDGSNDINFLLSFFPVSEDPDQNNYGFSPVYIIPTKTPKFNYDIQYKGLKLIVNNQATA